MFEHKLLLGMERVGYLTRTRLVIGSCVNDRVTRVLGANHLDALGL
mgnify:FL=1